MYEHFGFATVNREQNYYDNGHDALYMEMRLEDTNASVQEGSEIGNKESMVEETTQIRQEDKEPEIKTPQTPSEIYNEKRGISPVMAHKLANLFGTTPEFWMNAQTAYDLYKSYEKEKESIDLVKKIA